ncbi:hypothetical protein D5F53_26185 [Paenibacillus lautus]|jgi:hypothetical protein|uniref:DUF3899 domain-containing protein n=1 Tax=Paenibacillus lautus TaxID=1401 RepID=A0A385TVP3_PAELA|nr:hypothetical protein D5F53_26185 [Paenibacillus lautus]
MSGFVLIVFAAALIVRGVMRIRKPTWGSLYKMWNIKYGSEPDSDYIRYIKSSGIPLVVLGSIVLAFGILMVMF